MTVFTNGAWTPKEGHEAAFVEAWTDSRAGRAAQPGAGTIRPSPVISPTRSVSSASRIGAPSSRCAHGRSDEFRPRMGRVQEHVAEFSPDRAPGRGGAVGETSGACLKGRHQAPHEVRTRLSRRTSARAARARTRASRPRAPRTGRSPRRPARASRTSDPARGPRLRRRSRDGQKPVPSNGSGSVLPRSSAAIAPATRRPCASP